MGSFWKSVVDVIESLSLSGCYERVNKFMSLLTVDSLRKSLVNDIKGERILDVGCGPGNLSIVLCEERYDVRELVLVDPSVSMISKAVRTLKRVCSSRDVRIRALLGIFEHLPLKDESVDAVITAFAFRDAMDYRRALDEMWRVLVAGGVLGILDLYRPSSEALQKVIEGYLTLVPSLGSLLVGCPKQIGSYVLLKKTLERMPREVEITKMMEGRFSAVRFKSFYPGVGLWVARK